MRSWQYDTFSSSILFADAKNVHIMHICIIYLKVILDS
jgi:hypothetical protein